MLWPANNGGALKRGARLRRETDFGILGSMEKKKSFSEALRWGVATGTAAAKLPGMAFPTFADSRLVYKQVELRKAR